MKKILLIEDNNEIRENVAEARRPVPRRLLLRSRDTARLEGRAGRVVGR